MSALALSRVRELESRPPAPLPAGFVPGKHVRISPRAGDPQPISCGRCAHLDPGRLPCGVCGGSGCEDEVSAINGCGGGWVRCHACNGAGQTLTTLLELTEDTVQQVWRAFPPPMNPRLSAELCDVARAAGNFPDSLACSANAEHAAYRGSARPQLPGHDPGNALVRAEHFMDRIQRLPSIPFLEARAFWWPVLCATWSIHGTLRDFAVAIVPNGAVCVVPGGQELSDFGHS